MAHRHTVQRAKGGRVYYAGGESNVAKEAKSTTDGFKKGGKVHGKKGKHRLDKRARGGRTGSPFSSAHHGSGGLAGSHPHPLKTHGDEHKAVTHNRPL